MESTAIKSLKETVLERIEILSLEELNVLATFLNELEKENSLKEEILSYKGFLKTMDEDFKTELTTGLPEKRLKGSKSHKTF
ncbi:hypothetical protein M3O96_11775 [Aquiflexum sp. TKW24L]|uniref:hypothetical protein n=1 Tax=Aquiflexum sp. TKW24L TaxID=2942212 RepID=UPI0020BFBE71|nr:hypothetical protein [Aquiflexum sp. TKW24L]MCL6259771.1 hypothetical protein [Aquiflexum sp. TKW24L]